MTPQDVAILLQDYGSSWNEGADALDLNQVQERTNKLAPVLSSCKELWFNDLEKLELIVEKLADGSRDVAWRIPLGESGILGFFLDLLAEGNMCKNFRIHTLRLLGNACADTCDNRARVVENDRLLFVIEHVSDESLITFNIPVLYNILLDYEPAQSLASRSHLSSQLVNLFSSPNIANHAPLLPYISRILALLVSQDGEAAAADPATVSILLTFAQTPAAKNNMETYVSIISVAAAYLASEDLQSMLIEDNHVTLLLDTFYYTHASMDFAGMDNVDLAAQLKQLRSSLLLILTDVFGNDRFSQNYSLSDKVPQSLLEWLRGDNSPLQAAACLALGNISRSDAASVALIEKYKVHEILMKVLSNPVITEPQLQHAACSFLRNLAIPTCNRAQLGNLLLPSCLPRLLKIDTLPQVQFAAISLTRLLLLDCSSNVRHICTPLEDASSADANGREQTCANSIISLHTRSDAESTCLEAAKCVAGICRTLHSKPVSDALPEVSAITAHLSPEVVDEALRERFYQNHAVQGPLRSLITQEKWPLLRAEVWFVLALMSRSPSGSAVVLSVLDDEVVRNALKKSVTAPGLQLDTQQVGTKLQLNIPRVDTDNAIILCTELVKLGQHIMAPKRLAWFQELVHKGTQCLIASRIQS